VLSRTKLTRRGAPLTICAVVAVACVSAYAGAAMNDSTTPVVREALAAADDPAGAKGRTLGLSRVDVQPGAKLALHRHPGVQIARIDRGVLTYTVVDGRVDVMRGSPEADPTRVRTISSGQTAKIRAGQWIVERPGTIHRAANHGEKKIVIYIASLFKLGSPPAIPVER
jgi:quercetin dioxygenase-like cupin family protein